MDSENLAVTSDVSSTKARRLDLSEVDTAAQLASADDFILDPKEALNIRCVRQHFTLTLV